jgi:DnaJ-class molecular chaperone
MGMGRTETKPCPECTGTGETYVVEQDGPESVRRVPHLCDVCGGDGEVCYPEADRPARW